MYYLHNGDVEIDFSLAADQNIPYLVCMVLFFQLYAFNDVAFPTLCDVQPFRYAFLLEGNVAFDHWCWQLRPDESSQVNHFWCEVESSCVASSHQVFALRMYKHISVCV